jgi:hypothetical protein
VVRRVTDVANISHTYFAAKKPGRRQVTHMVEEGYTSLHVGRGTLGISDFGY